MKRWLLAAWIALIPSLAMAQANQNPLNNFTPANQIQGNAAGTTGAVVGTLTAVQGKTAFICGWNVQSIGGTAAVGPITVSGLLGGSQVYQGSSTIAGGQVAGATYNPCLPASAPATNIVITTTAAAGATAVDVNSWGFNF